MSIEEVEPLCLHIILTKLGPKDTAKLCCLNKRFKVSASDDSLWSKFCFRDLLLSSPLDPHGNACPSFFIAYRSWRHSFASYPFHLLKRLLAFSNNLNRWLSSNFPQIEKTLNKGATEEQILELEKKLGVKLPVTTRLLYRFFDGQDVRVKNQREYGNKCLLGLIGGYLFYDHFVNVYLLPLSDAIYRTMEVRRHWAASRFPDWDQYVVVAGSYTYMDKFFLLNCVNGRLYVGTESVLRDGGMIPCVPRSAVRISGEEQQDGLLVWLEEHLRRLENGVVKVREEESFKFVCQFPENSELCSSAVTNGVKVRASAVFVPELANAYDNDNKYWFAYSIRMSLLPEGCTINGIYFGSCQLHRRHWFISADGAVISEVHSEAVIGKYPLLLPGEEEFVYESCSPLPTASGSIKGSFTFVPGRLAEPKGGPFEVEVAEFPLRRQEYIF